MKSFKFVLPFIAVLLLVASCKNGKENIDATGTFEATEVIVSAEASGKIETLDLQEGDELQALHCVGFIDTTQLFLKKLQLMAAQKAVVARKPNVALQIASSKEQIEKAKIEKRRIENLLKDNAATQKQLDDINSQIKVLESALEAQINSLSTSVNSLSEESSTYQIQVAQIEDHLQKCRIINPIQGTVLSKYVEAKEIVAPGKALYKIADVKNLFLRAYVVAPQLTTLKLGQKVNVITDFGENGTKTYEGIVTWISDKAEFTPKTIQTKDERQNLVYAIKILVKNDGYLKIGMYADVEINK